MRAKHTALILTAGFLLLPTLSWSQFPGMGGGGFGGGSPMVMNLGGSGMPAGQGDGGRDRRIESYFDHLDVNQDGLLEHHELVGDPVAEDLSREFDKYDTDHSGAIDLPEFKAYMS